MENKEDRFDVKCGFCRQDVTCNDGKGIQWDTKWVRELGLWLCHYCYEGYVTTKMCEEKP